MTNGASNTLSETREVPPSTEISANTARDDSVIILRDISKEEAKQEIKSLLLSSPKPLDYGEILEQLGLDLQLIVQVCDELIREGIIEFI